MADNQNQLNNKNNTEAQNSPLSSLSQNQNKITSDADIYTSYQQKSAELLPGPNQPLSGDDELKQSNKRQIKIILTICVLICIGLFGFFYIVPKYFPKESSVSTQTSETPQIDTSKDPVQNYITLADTITKAGEKGTISFFPMANYSVSAEVKSALNYSDDMQSEFMPTDLALAWGDLANPEKGKGITYTQSGRWYFYVFDSTYKGNSIYIGQHSSNHHIIPANDNIKVALVKIKKGQKVKIDGYLVNVDYRFMDQSGFTQSSSLTREDTGDGACEVLYATKLQVEDKVYE